MQGTLLESRPQVKELQVLLWPRSLPLASMVTYSIFIKQFGFAWF